jgi:hypothetical protein
MGKGYLAGSEETYDCQVLELFRANHLSLGVLLELCY